MKNMTFKKITSQRLFLPIFCLALVLLINIVTTPNFFAIEVRNGVLYGYLIDIINRASELVILAVGMTLVVSSSAGTDISVGAIMAVSAAVCCNLLTASDSLSHTGRSQNVFFHIPSGAKAPLSRLPVPPRML